MANSDTLEQLAEIGHKAITYYAPKLELCPSNRLENTEVGCIRESQRAMTEMLSSVSYNAKDVCEFIYANSWNDIKDIQENKEFNLLNLISIPYSETVLSSSSQMKIMGVYSGVLVSELNRRNRELGKRAIFYFDGKGRAFDYLFLYIDDFDSLCVNNVKGDFICENAGNGKVLVGNKVRGIVPFSKICSESTYGVNYAAFNHIRGTQSISYCKGFEVLVVNDIKGDHSVCNLKKTHLMYADRIDGKYALIFSGSNSFPHGKYERRPVVNTMLLDRISGEDALVRTEAVHMIKRNKKPEKFDRLSAEIKVPEVLKILEEMNHGCKYSKGLRLFREICDITTEVIKNKE